MTSQKENFYFIDQDGKKYFTCVFCGDKCLASHSTEREYYPALCWHAELRSLEDKGLLCSNCYNWDFDLFRRSDSPRKRDPLKHRSGRLLGMKGWLDESNQSLESFF
jgi:hypothetical protein